jgi:hypothetical protein
LLTGQQQWAKTKGNPRTDGRICTPPPPPPPLDDETRREPRAGREWGAKAAGQAASVAWRIQASTSRAERGRDRHWHWQAGRQAGAASCRAVLVLEFLEACVRVCCYCWGSACVRARAAWGRLAGRSQPPSEFRRSVARSPAPASAPASLPHHRTCFVYKFSRPRPRIFITSSAILPADARRSLRRTWEGGGSEVRGKGDRRSCCWQCLALGSVGVT